MALYKITYLISLILGLTLCIQIPLKQGQFRCMLVYSVGNDQTVKIDINFPRLKDWTDKVDKYSLTMRNTKTNNMTSQQLSFGHFRREITINQKVIYELCFEFLSSRAIFEEIIIDYDADTHYMLDKSSIKIPQNLLKIEHMRETYQNVIALKNLTSNFKRLQQKRSEESDKQFQETQKIENKIMLVSIIEIIFILAAGVYQFVAFGKKLKENEYQIF